jgi:hypothetical protein
LGYYPLEDQKPFAVDLTGMKNELGQRGENLFSIIITRFYGRSQPIFRPQFLGDKWPTSDFIVELIEDTISVTPYFFVQVKTTRQGYDAQHRLKVRISAEGMQKLASLPAPTYVVGIDDLNEQGYIISANGEYSESVTSMSTEYPLNKHFQDVLWEEVKNYWERLGSFHMNSHFVDSNWR